MLPELLRHKDTVKCVAQSRRWRAPSKAPDALCVFAHSSKFLAHPSLIAKSRNNRIELVTGPVDRYVVALLAPASSVYRLQLRRPLVLARGTVTEKDDLKNNDKHQNGIAVGLATMWVLSAFILQGCLCLVDCQGHFDRWRNK